MIPVNPSLNKTPFEDLPDDIQKMLNQDLASVEFSIFDTETTGKNPTDKPIEIAVVNWSLNHGFDGLPHSWLIEPQDDNGNVISIPPGAMAVHGLFDEDVAGKPVLSEILPDFLNIIGNRVIVGHNVQFDLNMVPVLQKLPNLKQDTLRIAKHLYQLNQPGYKGHALSSFQMQELRYWFGLLKVDTMGLPAHRAAADIIVTGKVFEHMMKDFLQMKPDAKLIDFIDFETKPILTTKMPRGKYGDHTISEAILKEKFNSSNYFAWLLNEIHNKDFYIDYDQYLSICNELEKANFSVQGLVDSFNNKNKSYSSFSRK